MRAVFLMAGLMAFASAAQAEDWIAVCYGQEVQYTQTVGGKGFFHVPNANNGTYDTQKLVQSFYDGNLLCSVADPKAPRALSEVTEVCANKSKKTIAIMNLTDKKPVTPQNATVICEARISVF
jgi:hypothetical protein